MKKQIISSLAGGLVLFVTGYLIYVLLFQNTPEFIRGEGTMAATRIPQIYPLTLIMEICYGVSLTLIFCDWVGIRTFMDGLWTGMLIGFFVGLTFGMWMYAMTTVVNANGIFYYALTFAFRFSLAGGTVGWVLGKMKAPNGAIIKRFEHRHSTVK